MREVVVEAQVMCYVAFFFSFPLESNVELFVIYQISLTLLLPHLLPLSSLLPAICSSLRRSSPIARSSLHRSSPPHHGCDQATKVRRRSNASTRGQIRRRGWLGTSHRMGN